jgi:hypothetical protein
MVDLGDLTKLIKEGSSLSSLDWLEVDEKTYRENERLPKQKLHAVPVLEEQWGRLEERSSFRLSPDHFEPSNPTTPFWSERRQPSVLTDEKKSEIVDTFLKRHLQAGVEVKTALQILTKHFDKDTLNNPSVRRAVSASCKEAGLMGHVYVDTSIFPKCDQGEGQDFVAKHNKNTLYVLAKEKCGGCVWAQENKCSRFQKELITEVDYNEGLWSFYKSKAESQGKDLSGIKEDGTYKDKIRVANTAPVAQTKETLDGKPVQRDITSSLSVEEAEALLKSSEIRREIVANAHVENKIIKYSSRMLDGDHGPEVRDMVAHDPDLSSLRDHVGLLGTLYVDASFFSNDETFQEYRKAHPYLHLYDGTLKTDSLLRGIAERYAVGQWGYKGASDRTNSVLDKLKNLPENEVLKFAQEAFSLPLPTKDVQYKVVTPVYDPTQNITLKEAKRKLAAHKESEVSIVNTKKMSSEKALAWKMLEGDHSKQMSSRLRTANFDTLTPHLHLLGNLYVLSDYVTKDEMTRLAKKRPALASLPVINSSQVEDFFRQDSTKDRILGRYLQTEKGKKTSADKVSETLEKLSPSGIQKMASLVYSLPISTEKEYQGVERVHNASAHITDEQATKALKKAKVVHDKIRKDLTSYVNEGGNSILRPLLARFSSDLVKTLWLSKGKVATSVQDHIRREELEKKAYLTVVNPSFKPSKEAVVLIPSFFETRMGRWVRDKMVSGSTGTRLSEELERTWSEPEITQDIPVILAMRDEEGLYGKVYITADSYADCTVGKRASKGVQQIVKGSKCSGCVYNKSGSCLLYAKPLVKSPIYDQDVLTTSIQSAVYERRIGEDTASKLQESSSDIKERVRAANLAQTSLVMDRNISVQNTYKAYFGKPIEDTKREKRIAAMLKDARYLLTQGVGEEDARLQLLEKYGSSTLKQGAVYLDQVIDRTRDYTSEIVDSSNIQAPTGKEQLSEIELLPEQVSNALEDFDFDNDNKDAPMDDVSFGGLNWE